MTPRIKHRGKGFVLHLGSQTIIPSDIPMKQEAIETLMYDCKAALKIMQSLSPKEWR